MDSNKKREKTDLIVLLLYPIIATLISFIIPTGVLGSIVIFFGVPSFYLSYRAREHIKKSLIFSIILGIPFTIVIDYIANVTRAWIVPVSIFSYKFLGHIALEMFLWAILYSYFIIMFYEHFLDKSVSKKYYTKNTRYLVILMLVLVGIFFLFLIAKPTILHIPYSYLVMGIVFGAIPLVAAVLNFPRLISKFLKTGAYFFFLALTYEITALKAGWWDFPTEGEFIGWISFLGIRFPFEELLVWIMLTAIAVLAYYEYFDDDKK